MLHVTAPDPAAPAAQASQRRAKVQVLGERPLRTSLFNTEFQVLLLGVDDAPHYRLRGYYLAVTAKMAELGWLARPGEFIKRHRDERFGQ